MSTNFDPSARPTYSKAQIEAYLDTIALPWQHRASPIFSTPRLARSLTHGLPLLAALQKHQLASIPFENLGLHYAAEPGVDLAPQAVHSRSVALNCGRGGRCMENNNLFYHVLLSLGFDVVSTGGRVNEAVQPMSAEKDWPGPRYDGWNHRITLVKFVDDDGESAAAQTEKRVFLVDVGFGSQAPTRPMELIRGSEGVTILNVPPRQESRLRLTHIPDTVDKEQEMWVYEMKYGADKDWLPAYCFSETEFLPRDYETMSFFTSNNKKSWFTYTLVCVKMLLGKASSVEAGSQQDGVAGDDEDVIVGDVTLFNDTVKKRIGGKSEVVATLSTEAQRVAALKEWFGVDLTEAEREGIKNSMMALD